MFFLQEGRLIYVSRVGVGEGGPGETDLLQTQKSYRDANKRKRGGGKKIEFYFVPDFCSGEHDLPVAEGDWSNIAARNLIFGLEVFDWYLKRTAREWWESKGPLIASSGF